MAEKTGKGNYYLSLPLNFGKMNKKAVSNFLVVENKALNSTNFLIQLKSSEPIPLIKAGQFVNVEIKDANDIFLRRPFSVFEVDYVNNTISLIVKILGRGSKKLTEIKSGETLSIIYPLGNGFTVPEKGERVLLIGGGSGVAPILFLAKQSQNPRENVDILIGARSSADHINVENYSDYGKFHFTTEDGSLGMKGFVVHHLIFSQNLNQYDKIYACGPDAMMKAVAREAKSRGIFCEVSLENLMACGFGVCLCCIEPTVNGNVCVCTEGPVFNINDLKW